MRAEQYEEKRRFQRHERRCPMGLYRMDQQDQTFYAEMNDYCEDGMSLTTGEDLTLGHLLYLEVKGFNENYNGIVKWKAPASIPGSQVNGTYRYGIEYSRSEPRRS